MSQRNEIALDENRGAHTAKKFTCPACRKQKRFVKYYDFTTGEYLNDLSPVTHMEYGRCDREEHCGYFEAPYQDLKDKYNADNPKDKPKAKKPYTPPTPKATAAPIKPVDKDLVKLSLQFYDQNVLAQYLTNLLGQEIATQVINRYYIGTGRGGATIFWQIDRFMRIRTGQRIQYTPSGKRDRDIFPVRLFKHEDGYTACIFGEHLLHTEPDVKTIAIVESEKTAAIASAYLPTIVGERVLWMASSGVNGLTQEKIRPLSGYNIILVPDFSYHARATWGQVPMRKKKNEKGQNIPDADGDLIPDFVSYADKLRAIGCSVTFFDPCPTVTDSTDLCDLLLTLEPPKITAKPNFSKFRLAKTQPTISETIRTAPNSDELPSPDINILHSETKFKILPITGDRIHILAEPPQLIQSIENYLNKPIFRFLIEKLDICEGSIAPHINDDTDGKDNA